LSNSKLIAAYFSTLDGLLQSGDQVQAQQLCCHLKFLSKKATAFSTPAILQFRDEFCGMDVRGEVTYDNQTSLNDLQAHRFDCSVVKAPKIVSTDPLITVNSAQVTPHNWETLSVNTATSGTRIPINVQLPTRVYCMGRLHTTRCHVPSLSAFIITSTISGSLVLMLLTFHMAMVSAVWFCSPLSFPGLVTFESVWFCFLVGAINYPLPAC